MVQSFVNVVPACASSALSAFISIHCIEGFPVLCCIHLVKDGMDAVGHHEDSRC
jgi:hypothetical protein